MSTNRHDTSFSIAPIGMIASDFPDRFGVPRQPGLVPEATAQLRLLEPYDDPLAVRGLEGFSHLWLTFIFHLSPQNWKALVRPPRLGGNARIGVFASRSPQRPNRLGLSLVELIDVSTDHGVILTLRGTDLVHGTPVVDIKPYLPWAEARPNADTGFAPEAPPHAHVTFSNQALDCLASRDDGDSLRRLIEQVLAQDPRPAYRGHADQRQYGIHLRDINVRFRVLSDPDGQPWSLRVERLESRAARSP